MQKNPLHPFVVPFLRGYGSQEANVPQNVLQRSITNYSSGSLGELQNDATRFFYLRGGNWFAMDDYDTYIDTAMSPVGADSVFGDGITRYYLSNNGNGRPDRTRSIEPAVYQTHNDPNGKDYWMLTRPPMKVYTDSDGNAHEEPDYDSGAYHFGYNYIWEAWSFLALPTDNEIRPVNKAVRFFIKAR